MDLLISDTHFGADATQVEAWKHARFGELVDSLEGGRDRLLLLGDIFDVWLGWNGLVPAGLHRVLAILERAARRGVEIHFVVGNHDFAPGRFLRRELGIQIHEEAVLMPGRDGREALLLSHGDEPAGADRGYRLLRWVLRRRWVQWLIRAFPADAALAIGRYWSGKSRGHRVDPVGARRWLERYRDWVAQGYWDAGRRVVVCGHHHSVGILREGENALVNLGDWQAGATWAEVREGELLLLGVRREEGAPGGKARVLDRLRLVGGREERADDSGG